MNARRDRAIASGLAEWFGLNRRDLPWRTAPVPGALREPWAAFVAEAMLQQTQVARVLERFSDFLARFPTPARLAQADEQEVLAAWSGLGYYRRARNLHAAAKAIVEHHAGRVPSSVDDLRALPGVGPYTAGAIASIVFGTREPAVDGNIERVLLRLDAVDAPMSPRERSALVWSRASEFLRAAESPGMHNEALMELGALVCTPRIPRCPECPLRRRCAAHADGSADRIPAPKPRTAQRPLYHACVITRDRRGRLLIEQRSATGRGLWSGMWQPPALERDDRHATPAELARVLGLRIGPVIARLTHATTHRLVEFQVRTAEPNGTPPRRGRFVNEAALRDLPLSNPHKRLLTAALCPSTP